MAKPKPKETPISTSITLQPEVAQRITMLTGNRSKWIRDLINKELARVDKLNKVRKTSEDDYEW